MAIEKGNIDEVIMMIRGVNNEKVYWLKIFKLLKGQEKLLYDYYCYIYNNDNSISGDFVSDWFLRFCGVLFSLGSVKAMIEFDNGNAFLFSLPITYEKDYVLEKYIFGLISGIMFLLLGTVISLIENQQYNYQ